MGSAVCAQCAVSAACLTRVFRPADDSGTARVRGTESVIRDCYSRAEHGVRRARCSAEPRVQRSILRWFTVHCVHRVLCRALCTPGSRSGGIVAAVLSCGRGPCAASGMGWCIPQSELGRYARNAAPMLPYIPDGRTVNSHEWSVSAVCRPADSHGRMVM